MKLLKKKNKNNFNCKINESLKEIINYYALKNNLSFNDAVNDLVEKGYNYWLLEKKYGNKIDSEEVWSNSLKILKIEAGFLYYRLRTRELIEELKNIVFILSGVIGDLESCYETLRKYRDINIKIEELKKYKGELEKYLKNYIFKNEKELEEAETRYISDLDSFISEVKKLLDKISIEK